MGAEVILTDQQPLLPLLESNISSNRSFLAGKISVCQLDWGNDSVQNLNPPFDFIIGTDIIFKMDYIPLLINILCEGSNPKTIIFICFENRDPEVTKCFLTYSDKYFFKTKISTNKIHSEHVSEFSQLYLLRKKSQEE